MDRTDKIVLAVAVALAAVVLRAGQFGGPLPAALAAVAGTLITGMAVLCVLAVAGGGWRPRT